MSNIALLLTRDFGKADAKVLFFHQSTKFNSGFFQKNFIFNFYFDKRQAVELILPLTVDDFGPFMKEIFGYLLKNA